MPGKILVLTGAPEFHRLDWSDSELLTTFQPSVAQFALLQPPGSSSSSSHPDKSLLHLAVWRSLPLQRAHIHTGFSQQHDLQFIGRFPSSADFLTTADVSFQAASLPGSSQEDSEGASRLLAEFYEHSLAVHDDLATSQLVPPSSGGGGGGGGQGDAGAAILDETTSFDADDSLASRDEDGDSTSFLTTDGATLPPKTPLIPAWGVRGADHRLTDLQDIPSAKVLLSVAPQTVTVNLIVCIISIAAPRIVETRYGRTSTLVEVLVGDETKSGFSVTFWLSETNHNNKNNNNNNKAAHDVLEGLRSQDIVLMQNVALNVFRNKVYGGSLRRDMTKVHLLFRGRLVDKEDVGGYYSRADLAKFGRFRNGRQQEQQQQQHPQLEKTKRVREWVLDFVGGGSPVIGGHGGAGCEEARTGTKRKRKGKEGAPPPRDWEQPPPLDSPSRLR